MDNDAANQLLEEPRTIMAIGNMSHDDLARYHDHLKQEKLVLPPKIQQVYDARLRAADAHTRFVTQLLTRGGER